MYDLHNLKGDDSSIEIISTGNINHYSNSVNKLNISANSFDIKHHDITDLSNCDYEYNNDGVNAIENSINTMEEKFQIGKDNENSIKYIETKLDSLADDMKYKVDLLLNSINNRTNSTNIDEAKNDKSANLEAVTNEYSLCLDDKELGEFNNNLANVQLKYNDENKFEFYIAMSLLKMNVVCSYDYSMITAQQENISKNLKLKSTLDNLKKRKRKGKAKQLESITHRSTFEKNEFIEQNDNDAIEANLLSTFMSSMNINETPWKKYMFKTPCPFAEKWRKNNTKFEELGFYERLHEEILAFINSHELRKRDCDVRSEIFAVMVHVSSRLWPNCKLIPFGSFSTGTSIRNGDVDICLVDVDIPKETSKSHLYRLAAIIKNMKFFAFDVYAITKAKIPLVRFKHRKSNMQVDVSFNQLSAVETTRLMKWYLSTYAPLRPILLLLKLLLKSENYSETFKGGVGSYMLFIMIVYHFQREICDPIREKENYTSLLKTYKICKNTFEEPANYEDTYRNLGMLFESFLYRFKYYQYYVDTLDIRNGGTVHKNLINESNNNNVIGLSIISPLAPTHDIGLKSYNYYEVFNLFLKIIGIFDKLKLLEHNLMKKGSFDNLRKLRNISIIELISSFHTKSTSDTMENDSSSGDEDVEYRNVYEPFEFPQITKKMLMKVYPLIVDYLKGPSNSNKRRMRN